MKKELLAPVEMREDHLFLEDNSIVLHSVVFYHL